MHILEEGTKVVCPGCKVAIYEINQDLVSHVDLVTPDIFDPIWDPKLAPHRRPEDSDFMKCPLCSDVFARATCQRGTTIHTEYGWKP